MIWTILAIVFGAFILINDVIAPLIIACFVGRNLFKKHLIRPGKNGWPRECSDPTNYEQMVMWKTGLDWAKENVQYKNEVEITSAGYHLVGEYYDFGFKRAVIIIPGRTETVFYSYYYAQGFKNAGYNVLCIDKRAHGLSEGEYEDGGKYSHVDIHAWARLLEERFQMHDVTLHGICIGSSQCIYAASSPACPENITRVITDGMFATFGESFKEHMAEQKRQIFPTLQMTMLWGKKYTKVNHLVEGPIKEIGKLKKPILMIYTKMDRYSTESQAKRLYEKCGSEEKELRYFPYGCHSHVRLNNTEGYDALLKEWGDRFSA